MKKIATALTFFLIVPFAYSMQQTEKVLAELLAIHKIPDTDNQPQTQSMLNQALIGHINNDNPKNVTNTLKLFLERFNGIYNLNLFIDVSNQRIGKFAFVNLAIKRGFHPKPKKNEYIFYEHRKKAFKIGELLKRYSDTAPLHKAIQRLDILTVTSCMKHRAQLEWKDDSGKHSFDHLYETLHREFIKPYNFKNKRKILVIQKILTERRDKVFIWTIKHNNFEVVKKMVALGASPFLYIADKKMTALGYARLLKDSVDAVSKDQQLLMYNFLKQTAEHSQESKSPDETTYPFLILTEEQCTTDKDLQGASSHYNDASQEQPSSAQSEALPLEGEESREEEELLREAVVARSPSKPEAFKYYVSLPGLF